MRELVLFLFLCREATGRLEDGWFLCKKENGQGALFSRGPSFTLLIVEEGTVHVWKPEDSVGAHSLSSVWVLWTKLRSPGFETSIFYLPGHLASFLSFCVFYLLMCVHGSVSVCTRVCRCLQRPEASIGCPGAVVTSWRRL